MNLDIVIIGRNSQKHLGDCIQSVLMADWSYGEKRVYYVDGRSTDQSLSIAKSYGIYSEILKSKTPSAAAGRNQGGQIGNGNLIQFIDSDVVIQPEWLEVAGRAMTEDTNLAAVRGRLQEKFPQKNLYHFSAALEWDEKTGPCEEIGGIVMVRRSMWEKVGGYPLISSGEDPELGRRIINSGGTMEQLDASMGTHDIDIPNFRKWFQRSVRSGETYFSIGMKNSLKGDLFWIREQLRIFIRGVLPYLIIMASPFSNHFAILIFLSLAMVFQPTITSIPLFMKRFKLSVKDAGYYSLACSIVALPQGIGALRYFWSRVEKSRIFMISLACFFVGCNAVEPIPNKENSLQNSQNNPQEFRTEKSLQKYVYATQDVVEELNGDDDHVYLVGPGDKLSLKVWNRNGLSVPEITVGPDGQFQVPRIGMVNVTGKSCEQLNMEIKSRLSILYEDPEVNLSIVKFNNNRAYVLGRVANPGLIRFQGKGTLLEAISLAGGLPVLAKKAFLTRCAIIRGSEKIVWVDLRELLSGNMGLNARIKNGDTIYIPESGDEMVYVMGAVKKPGALILKERLSFLDAVMMSGGPTRGILEHKAFLVRQLGEGQKIVEIDLKGMIEMGDQSSNYILKDNDIVFVAQSGVEKINTILNDSLPFLQVMSLGTGVANSLGITSPANLK